MAAVGRTTKNIVPVISKMRKVNLLNPSNKSHLIQDSSQNINEVSLNSYRGSQRQAHLAEDLADSSVKTFAEQ